MICGKLDGWRQIDGVHGLEAGFEFLERSNLGALAMGKHEIQGEAVFALAMKAPSRAPEAGRFESHRDYIDIQFLFAGEETIGVVPTGQLQGATPYDAAKDIVFYAAPARYLALRDSARPFRRVLSRGGPSADVPFRRTARAAQGGHQGEGGLLGGAPEALKCGATPDQTRREYPFAACGVCGGRPSASGCSLNSSRPSARSPSSAGRWPG